MKKLPTKIELISCCLLLSIGLFMLWYFPAHSNAGWYVIVLGVTFGLFPGPQLKAKFEPTNEKTAQQRQDVIAARENSFSWWASPFPWGLAVLMLALVFAFTA
ncbi:MAG: hypothetical protein KJ556_06825 [Gammaproteobacteria bacterium]|nr:hypothetical protein [Gammaproteobacteria bacterium]MBU2057222.1 hypothetical protein [Gammaproteobacteria bacterium]MBU2174824.1 hypothetical protein [Gammaproteobacteria bacterium]MBU2245429.1 hypothetical protein [Gammaproteobacteria bacterium]MBU2344210.1 hypothetical protein [Gammaproteobacteria bacterium]